MTKARQGESQKQHLRHPLIFAEALLLCICFEAFSSWFAWNYFSGGFPKAGPAAITLHVLAALCFVVYRPGTGTPMPRLDTTRTGIADTKEKNKRDVAEEKPSLGDAYYHRLFAMLVFFLPGFGAVGGLATFISARVILKRQGLAESYEESFKMGEDALFLGSASDDLLQEELSIEPIVDILAGDDVALKRGCISLLRKMKNKRAVELLKQSLADPSPEIRFYAHTALTRIESDFAELLGEAQKRREEEDSPYSARVLARVYRRYAASGLPEDSMRRQYLQDARDLYELALAADPDDARLMLTLGNLCAEMKNFTDSETYFRMAVDIKGCQLEAGLGICRALYETGRMKELIAFSRRLARMERPTALNPEKQAVYDLWAGIPDPGDVS